MTLFLFAIITQTLMNKYLIWSEVIIMKFREVERNIEREKLNKKKEEGYKKIKPESNITLDEAKNFINGLFESARES